VNTNPERQHDSEPCVRGPTWPGQRVRVGHEVPLPNPGRVLHVLARRPEADTAGDAVGDHQDGARGDDGGRPMLLCGPQVPLHPVRCCKDHPPFHRCNPHDHQLTALAMLIAVPIRGGANGPWCSARPKGHSESMSSMGISNIPFVTTLEGGGDGGEVHFQPPQVGRGPTFGKWSGLVGQHREARAPRREVAADGPVQVLRGHAGAPSPHQGGCEREGGGNQPPPPAPLSFLPPPAKKCLWVASRKPEPQACAAWSPPSREGAAGWGPRTAHTPPPPRRAVRTSCCNQGQANSFVCPCVLHRLHLKLRRPINRPHAPTAHSSCPAAI
jgi:hypothetical protein